MSDHIKHVIDAFSVSAVLATLAGWLPVIAAVASLVWSCIRIYETKTIQKWLGK
jgi:CHASE2 domain-containing sensor protein